ncbi:hypothetical protein TSAR_004172 [Trichomalopsis sarcophagae]|uniref:Uncharacterized protein n=1 Tax=Trichomalopsis sarcophagae TaxID=543379 RepID=A0A232EI09_9HYME|nr:hypothetical protein TSAR_004172 [Trichomalopsis sarcophagae]
MIVAERSTLLLDIFMHSVYNNNAICHSSSQVEKKFAETWTRVHKNSKQQRGPRRNDRRWHMKTESSICLSGGWGDILV